MGSIEAEIREMLAYYAGKSLTPAIEDDVLGQIGMEGDDGDEFIEDYATRFSVNLVGFLDYFHYNVDEPPGHRRVFPVLEDGTVPPYIPITLAQLVEAAQIGRWEFDYPAHKVEVSLKYKALKYLGPPLLLIVLVWYSFHQ